MSTCPQSPRFATMRPASLKRTVIVWLSMSLACFATGANIYGWRRAASRQSFLDTRCTFSFSPPTFAPTAFLFLANSENVLLSKLFGGSGSKKRRDRKRGGNLAVDVTVSDKMLRASMKRVRESLAKTKKFTVAYTFKVWPCNSHSSCAGGTFLPHFCCTSHSSFALPLPHRRRPLPSSCKC